jgi:hypothetical protein
MLSINYLSLRLLFLASIYVSPYLATAFHRAQKVASGTNRQTEIRLRYRGSPNSPQFWSIALGNSSPPQGDSALYIAPERFCQRESGREPCKV